MMFYECVELGVPIYDKPVCADQAHTETASCSSLEALPMIINMLLDNGSSDIWSEEFSFSIIGLGGSTVFVWIDLAAKIVKNLIISEFIAKICKTCPKS